MFVPGKSYKRKILHNTFGGNRQKGISTPANSNIIFLFTGESGIQYGYSDGWTKEGVYLFYGEGQKGDMTLTSGNLQIYHHIENGKDLHLFTLVEPGHYEYINQMICTGIQIASGPDVNNTLRKVYIFELTSVNEFSDDAYTNNSNNTFSLDQQSLSELRRKALKSIGSERSAKERRINALQRSQAVKYYALSRANGYCEGCKQQAPFRKPNGDLYLEVHRIRSLSDFGPDDPGWVISLCPNCHRRAHHSHDRSKFNDALSDLVNKIEKELAVSK